MVKKILRTFVIEGTALYLASQIAQGLQFNKGLQSLVATAIALTLASFVVKPIITLLILPINLVTFNFFRWASHGITLFLVDLALDEFQITNFVFNGFHSEYFDLPSFTLEQGVGAYLAFSFLIAIIAGSIYWLIDRK